MIHATIDRVRSLGGVSAPIVVTNIGQAVPVARALLDAGISDATTILEPMGRNTAPAVAVAALEVLSRGQDAILLVLPADHAISDLAAFAGAIDVAARAADEGYLVTFGIAPTSPETGYGYIRAGDRLTGDIRRITEFREKPDEETAREYVASGAYSWNSGMFIFRAKRYLDELEDFRPDITAATTAAFDAATRSGRTVTLDPAAFAASPSDSIDFAVMEHTDSGAVLAVDPGWNDVGSWSSLWDIGEKDGDANVVRGDVVAIDTEGSYVRASERLVAVVGMTDVVIVDTPDALLVTTKDGSQQVKAIVERLRLDGRSELETNGTEYESWGTARLIGKTPGHRTHVVTVDPGAVIPSEVHSSLSEIWQVIRGTAEVTIDTDRTVAGSGTSIHVPAGRGCSLRNPSTESLMLIRIRVDSVIEEDELASFIAKEGPTA
jgi:mannose-1-phosphate guanylyltransferase / mannose-6-phosphate isomerase